MSLRVRSARPWLRAGGELRGPDRGQSCVVACGSILAAAEEADHEWILACVEADPLCFQEARDCARWARSHGVKPRSPVSPSPKHP